MREFWKLAALMFFMLLVTGALYQIAPRFPWGLVLLVTWLGCFFVWARWRKRDPRKE